MLRQLAGHLAVPFHRAESAASAPVVVASPKVAIPDGGEDVVTLSTVRIRYGRTRGTFTPLTVELL